MSSKQSNKRKEPTPALAEAATAAPVTTKKAKTTQPTILSFDSEADQALPRAGIEQQLVSLDSKIPKTADNLFASKRVGGDDEDEEQSTASKNTSKGKKATKPATDVMSNLTGEKSINASIHITPNALNLGDLFLGTVCAITPFYIKVSLPDGMIGTVSLRDISDTLTAKIDKNLDQHMSTPLDASQFDDALLNDVPSLEELFTPGQQVVAMLINLNTQHSKKERVKYKLELTLRPSLINAAINTNLQLIHPNMQLVGDVQSVEEKGYVINYGLPFTGFLPFDACDDNGNLKAGQIVPTILPNKPIDAAKERTVVVGAKTKAITSHAMTAMQDLVFDQLRAGQFHVATVTKHLKDGGLVVKLLEAFEMTISSLRLPQGKTNASYNILSKVNVRVLYINPTTKQSIGSLQPHLTTPRRINNDNIDLSNRVQLGDIKQAKIVKNLNEKVLVVELLGATTKETEGLPVLGWLPLRNVSDLALTEFPKQYKVGGLITTRVVGFNLLDGFVQVATRPSLLQAQALSFQDLKAGEKFTGIVIATLQSPSASTANNNNNSTDDKKKGQYINNGVIVQISPQVTAFIPVSQLTNQGGKKVGATTIAKFALGSKHEVRILTVDPSTRKAIATAKPSMVQRAAEEQNVTSYEQAREVLKQHKEQNKAFLLGGYVDKCTDDYVVVRFYNHIGGVVTKQMLVKQGVITEKQRPQYLPGEFILTRVINVYKDKLSLSLSLTAPTDNKEKVLQKTERVTPHRGQFLPILVYAEQQGVAGEGGKKEREIAFQLVYAGKTITAYLPFNQMGDSPAQCESTWKQIMREQKLNVPAFVFGFDQQKRMLISIKPSYYVAYGTVPQTTEVNADLINAINTKETSAQKLIQALTSFLLPSIQLPNPMKADAKTSVLVGTIAEVQAKYLRVQITPEVFSIIPGKQCTAPLDTYRVGQTILFGVQPNQKDKTKKVFTTNLSHVMNHRGAAILSILTTLAATTTAGKGLSDVITTNKTTLPQLGAVLSGAKLAKKDGTVATFTTTESVKAKYTIVYQVGKFDQTTAIQGFAVGLTMDVIVVGLDHKTNVVSVITLAAINDLLKKVNNGQNGKITALRVGVDRALIGSMQFAIPLAGSNTSTNPTTLLINGALAIMSNTIAYNNTAVTADIAQPTPVFVLSENIVLQLPSVFGKTKPQQVEPKFPPNTFFSAATLTTPRAIAPMACIEVEPVGLVKGFDTSKIYTLAQLKRENDLTRVQLFVRMGPHNPAHLTAADRYAAYIPISLLTDPAPRVAVEGKKTKKTKNAAPALQSVFDTLQTLLPVSSAKKTPTPQRLSAVVVSTTLSKQIVAIPSLSTKPLGIITTFLSLRQSDVDNSLFSERFSTDTYLPNTIHDAVVTKITDFGITAQVTPFLSVSMRASACGEGYNKTINVGDVVTFKVTQQKPGTKTNSTTLFGALIHPTLNPDGVDANPAAVAAAEREEKKKNQVVATYNIGDTVENAVVQSYNEKGAFYIVQLPGNVIASINLAELMDYEDIQNASEDVDVTTHYERGDVIPAVTILGSLRTDPKQNTPMYVASARPSRSALFTPSNDKKDELIAHLAQVSQNNNGLNKKSATKTTAPTPTTTDADIAKDFLCYQDLKFNQYLLGFITAISPKGVFVQLSAVAHGLIYFKNLADNFIDYNTIVQSKLYTVGQSLVLRVDSFDVEKKMCSLIAKPSQTNLADAKIFNALAVGDVVKGVVSNVRDNGVFIKLKHTATLTGLAYKTEILDETPEKFDLLNYYKIGDVVKAVVIRKNLTNRNISLALKSSAFAQYAKDESSPLLFDGEDDDEDDIEEELSQDSASSEDDDNSEANNTMSDDIAPKQTTSAANKVLSTLFSPLDAMAKKTNASKTMADEDEEEGEGLVSFNADVGSLIGASAADTTTAIDTQRHVEQLEHALTKSAASANTTADQYELQCAMEPNNASIWVGYIAMLLEQNNVTKARAIVTKALSAIAPSAVEQRYNVFSASLSLETLYGTPTSIEKALKAARAEFDGDKVYAEMARISTANDKLEQAVEYYNKAIKACGLSTDKASNTSKPALKLANCESYYTSLIALMFAQAKRPEAHRLLKQAVKQLPPANSTHIVIKTILLEYQSEHGSVDNGREMFQQFLTENPKRLDVWTTMIQQEIKQYRKIYAAASKANATQQKKTELKRQKTRIRELFDIFIAQTPSNQYGIDWNTFKVQQVKAMFSAALEFENDSMMNKDENNTARVDLIKERAKLYVQHVSSSQQ